MTSIRARAQSFELMPPVLSRTIGHVMLWAVISCSNNVEKLRQAEFETGAQLETIAMCKRIANDINLFAGQIRFKLPGRVWEALAKATEALGA